MALKKKDVEPNSILKRNGTEVSIESKVRPVAAPDAGKTGGP